MRKINKILINALSGIGDALMFTPALVKLREHLPDARIDVMVMLKGVKDFYEQLEEIDDVYYFDFINAGAVKSFQYVIGMRGKYDASVNVYPSNRREYNGINFLVGAKYRAGVRYLRKDLQNFGFLNNRTIVENDDLHNVEENIKMVEKLLNIEVSGIPKLKFPLLKKDKEYAAGYLESLNIKEEELVFGIHPGCSTLKNHIKRRWEPEKFAELGRQLIDQFNSRVLIFGGPEESELKGEIKKNINSEKVVAIKTDNLRQSAAIMERCNVFITNDSSLMHIASALQLNVVAVIGPTNTNYIHPWKTDYKIASLNLECAPCFFYSPKPLTCYRTDVYFKCIKELSVDLVMSKVKEFLDEKFTYQKSNSLRS
jgi:heptosyltransferase-2